MNTTNLRLWLELAEQAFPVTKFHHETPRFGLFDGKITLYYSLNGVTIRTSFDNGDLEAIPPTKEAIQQALEAIRAQAQPVAEATTAKSLVAEKALLETCRA